MTLSSFVDCLLRTHSVCERWCLANLDHLQSKLFTQAEKERAEASAAQVPELQRQKEEEVQLLQAKMVADLSLAQTQAQTLQHQLDESRALLTEARGDLSASDAELGQVQRALKQMQQQWQHEVAQRRHDEFQHFKGTLSTCRSCDSKSEEWSMCWMVLL